MNSLEFTTKIEHGVIRLPKEFEDYDNAVAHVTVTLETTDEKAKLLTTFKKTETEIDWQERNEKFQKRCVGLTNIAQNI